MARSRNIKPGFFKNEQLAEIEPLGRLLFAGLWCLADREGRLEDRPKRIKAEILPYDECDVDALLWQLAEKGFIIRYEIDGEQYIQVAKFTIHQNPHPNEKPSVIPAPNEIATIRECSVSAREKSVTTREKNVSAHADSLFSDSLILIPDSPIQDPDPSIDSLGDKKRESAAKEEGCGEEGPARAVRQPKPKVQYADYVSMTEDEYRHLVDRLGSESRAARCIEILNNYKGSTGKRYKSDYLAILNWVINRLQEEESKKGIVHPTGRRDLHPYLPFVPSQPPERPP